MREFGFAKCNRCQQYVSLVQPNEAMCLNCGRIFRVKNKDIKWVREDEARIAANLLRERLFISREVPA